MKRVFYGTLTVLLLVFSVSCSKKDESVSFGTLDTYSDFLWRAYSPEMMTKTLSLQFSKKAIDIGDPVVFVFWDNVDERPVPTSVAKVYVNGKEAPDNIIKVFPAKNVEVEIGVLLDKSQTGKSKSFNWTFQIRDYESFDRINDAEKDDIEAAGGVLHDKSKEIKFSVHHHANSLKVIVMTIIITLVVLLIAWLFLVHFVLHPHFTNKQLTRIFVMDGDSRKAIISVKPGLKGARSIVFTPKSQSQGFLSFCFTGKVKYLTVPKLEGELNLTPGKGFQTKARYSAKYFSLSFAGNLMEKKIIRANKADYAVEIYCKKK